MARYPREMGFKKEFRAAPVKLGPRYRAIEAQRRRRRDNKWVGGVLAVSAVGMVFGLLAPTTATPSEAKSDTMRLAEKSVYYAGCNEARAAGAAPIYEGQPGYRPEMDGDGDGIACEPHRED